MNNDEKQIVYLDTEVFQGIQYNFSNKFITSVLNLAKINVLELRLTSINHIENLRRIEKRIDEISRIYKKNRKELYFLNQIESFRNNFCLEKIGEYQDEILEGYNKNISKYFKIINKEQVEIQPIFDAYFDNKAPFNKELKKHEFPDAISVMIIKNTIQEKEKTIIVSHDQDIKDLVDSFGFTSEISVIPNLGELLDNYNKETEFYEQFVEMIYKDDFKEKIEEKFSDIEFTAIGDYDPYIETSEFQKTNGIFDVKILDINEDYISFSFLTFINSKFEITATDPDCWHYDSEDKIAYYFEKEKYEREEQCSVTFTVEMEKDGEEWEIAYFEPESYIEIEFDPYEDVY